MHILYCNTQVKTLLSMHTLNYMITATYKSDIKNLVSRNYHKTRDYK